MKYRERGGAANRFAQLVKDTAAQKSF